MLDGFGLTPVCLELDLDSYDGPWTHVERFRGRSGWLAVAEAVLTGGGESWMTSIVAACDEWGNPIPGFMAPNLLACACSLPEVCHEYPPDELEDGLKAEARALKLRWLRENNQTLRKLDRDVADQVATMEAAARYQINELDARIADLRRRRRMPGVEAEAHAIFSELIREFEELQDFVLERLDRERAELRAEVDRMERQLLARYQIRVRFEPLYTVRWFAAPRWSEEREVAFAQVRRTTNFVPKFTRRTHLDPEELQEQLEKLSKKLFQMPPTAGDDDEGPLVRMPEASGRPGITPNLPQRRNAGPEETARLRSSRSVSRISEGAERRAPRLQRRAGRQTSRRGAAFGRFDEEASLRHAATLLFLRSRKVRQEMHSFDRHGPERRARIRDRFARLLEEAGRLAAACENLPAGSPARKAYEQAMEHLQFAEQHFSSRGQGTSETL